MSTSSDGECLSSNKARKLDCGDAASPEPKRSKLTAPPPPFMANSQLLGVSRYMHCPTRSVTREMRVKLINPCCCSGCVVGAVIRSLLYNGSRFAGHQKSKGSCYDVEVMLQNVDEVNSYLCGYLKIIGKCCLGSLQLCLCVQHTQLRRDSFRSQLSHA